MDETHGRDGRGTHYRSAETGRLVAKSDDAAAFWRRTAVSLAGVLLVLSAVGMGPAWLGVPGALTGLYGVSMSYTDRRYSHWYGLLVAIICFGGPVVMALRAVRDLLGLR